MQSDFCRGPEISLLCAVCDWAAGEKVEALLGEYGGLISLVTHGRGTAAAGARRYLGLTEVEKAVFLCLLPWSSAHGALEKLGALLEKKPGRGVVFTMDTLYGCYNRPVPCAGGGGGTQMTQTPYSLICAVFNQGYSGDVAAAAQAGGAPGGTVLHGRGAGADMVDKFFGMTVAPEKELLLILAPEAHVCAIMAAIAEKTGPDTDARAVSFALPVSHVRGLRTGDTGQPDANGDENLL